MGLLIKLNNGDTSLKSLKFGKDRPGGGDSGQPYIKKPIADQPLPFLDGDGLLRGGLRAPLRSIDDAARLTSYFFDFKNPSGLIFTAKQNLLSRIATKTEVSQPNSKADYIPNSAYAKGKINEGLYLPTSTILQAADNFLGGHLNKQGIDPTGIKDNLSITPYSKVATLLNKSETNKFPEDIGTSNGEFDNFSNRLLSFWGTKQINISDTSSPPVLYSYTGGAGSTLGIGETSIKYATMPDGITPVRTGTKNSKFTNEETRDEYINGKILPSNRTYINWVDGVPLIQPFLDDSKFVKASAVFGVTEDKTRDSNFNLIGTYSYTFLSDKASNIKIARDPSVQTPRPRNGTGFEKEKFQFPVGASQRYNAAIKPLIENTVAGLKLDYEAVKKEKIVALSTQITKLIRSKRDPKNWTVKQVVPRKFGSWRTSTGTPSAPRTAQQIQNDADLEASVQNSTLKQQYKWVEDPDRKIAVQATIQKKIDKLIKERADLEASQFDPDNIDGPLPILSSALGRSGKSGLERGESHFYYGNSNKSVYKRDEQGVPTLVQRDDSDYLNLTPTLNEILLRRQPIYKAGTTDARFPKIVLENRVHTGDPGSTKGSRTRALDKINAKAPYTGKTGQGDFQYRKNANDFAHFRVGVLDPFIPQNAAYMNFRALIESVSDNYSAEWNAQKYMGRAEKFYKYGGFDRKMSLSFKVVVMSQAEMKPIYSKLNYLASSLAPAYSPQGYMAGNIALLTLGEYVYEQYGIITSLDYTIPKESSWELIIGEGKGLDELPFMIDVSMNFTPIHNFRPEVGNHNRYITHNMSLPYSGRPLKDIREDEYTPEVIPEEPETVKSNTTEDISTTGNSANSIVIGQATNSIGNTQDVTATTATNRLGNPIPGQFDVNLPDSTFRVDYDPRILNGIVFKK